MTEGYMTVKEIVEMGKAYIIQNSKIGFTKSITATAVEDVTLEDGRYVISTSKIADIKIDNDKHTIIWYKSADKNLYNTYVGGWFNKERSVYEIETVVVVNLLTNAIGYALKYKQRYIYDLKDKKAISVVDLVRLKHLKSGEGLYDGILEGLQHLYDGGRHTDATKLDFLYDEVMQLRKSTSKRISLLKSQGEL